MLGIKFGEHYQCRLEYYFGFVLEQYDNTKYQTHISNTVVYMTLMKRLVRFCFRVDTYHKDGGVAQWLKPALSHA